MCNGHSILGYYVMFTGVKLSMRLFNLFIDFVDYSFLKFV